MNFIFRGCKMNLGVPFLAFITGALILDKSGNMIWCLLATTVHEIGHIVCILSQKNELHEIKFCLMDIKILDKSNISRSYKDDIILMAAGPLANFLFALVFGFVNLFFHKEHILIFVVENLFLGFFNLLPIDFLDGGKILFSILSLKFKEKKAESILNYVSVITLFPMSAIGFYILLKSKYNFSLLLIAVYLIVRIIFKSDVNQRWCERNF